MCNKYDLLDLLRDRLFYLMILGLSFFAEDTDGYLSIKLRIKDLNFYRWSQFG